MKSNFANNCGGFAKQDYKQSKSVVSLVVFVVFLFSGCKSDEPIVSDTGIPPVITIEAYNSQPVYAGGVWSLKDEKGMDDLANPANSDSFRAKGGRLYIHELGWDYTSKANQAIIAGLFPNSPMWESSYSETSGVGHIMSILRGRLVTYWKKADYLTVNFLSDKSTAQMQEVRDSTNDFVGKVAPIFSPNSGAWNGAPWNSTKWDQTRVNIKIGGALATDSPPYFYLSQPEGYKAFIADEIKWCKANNIDMIAIIHPGTSVDFNEDFRKYRADLKARGAVPDIWAVECYYGGPGGLHPIGSEETANDLMYTALKNTDFTLSGKKNFSFTNSLVVDPLISAEFQGVSNIVIGISGVDSVSVNKVSKIELYIEDQLVKTKLQAPFEWNKNGEDALLSHLAIGKYKLKFVSTDALGLVKTYTIKIQISK
jgi:hypothetical protein